jgi:Protein of unknown function (DUF3800)
MLKAFIDDSRMNQAPMYILGGWCAPAKVWAPFSDGWRDILNFRRRLEYFKFEEAMGLTGQFHGMSEEDRDERLKLLVDLVVEHKLVGFAAGIPHHHFYPVFGTHHDPEVRNPYHLAFYLLISRMVDHYVPLGVKEKIDFLFDYQPGSNSMEMVRRGWGTFLSRAPAAARALLHNHPPNFFDDRQVVALQAADMLAGWVRTYNEEVMYNRPPPRPVWGDRGDPIDMHLSF